MFACINRIPKFSWPYHRHEEKKDHSSQPYEDPEMTFLLPPRDMITGAVAAISDPRGDLENGSHTLRKQEEQKTREGGPGSLQTPESCLPLHFFMRRRNKPSQLN